jgi:hypothetical protein
MPELNLDCDVKQGYDFKKDASATVGYLTELILGGQALAVDQTMIKDPLKPDAALGSGVVAVLSSASWGMGPTNAMYFTGQISAANMQTLRAFMTKVTDLSVKLKFVCYQFDFVAMKMFKSFHSGDAELAGLIEKKGAELSLHFSATPLSFPPKPKTFPFSIGIVPAHVEQPIQLATSDTVKFTMPWGQAVG